jgi:hypothetical protein
MIFLRFKRGVLRIIHSVFRGWGLKPRLRFGPFLCLISLPLKEGPGLRPCSKNSTGAQPWTALARLQSCEFSFKSFLLCVFASFSAFNRRVLHPICIRPCCCCRTINSHEVGGVPFCIFHALVSSKILFL